ncbi:MAG: small multi-drug export protein [Butyricicoccus pullicaecorum]|nr:small multi-drug export protein [Butyricicoccus pullicaecorum]MDO4669199.1 small multi-drug export protein [Butyricicoccus pullicaecorum]
MESLFTWLEAAGKETALFLVSMLPLVELRGAVPLGVAAGMPWYEILPICYLGNLLPIPFLLLFTERLLDWLARMPGIKGAANWYASKLNSKKEQITKYAKWGLFLFVAVPLPGTGAWSGAMIASILKMPPVRAFVSIAAGVVAAGLIMAIASSGLFSLFA